MKSTIAAAVAAVAILGGCSGGDDGPEVAQTEDTGGQQTDSSTTTTEAPPAPAEDTVAYFEAFVGNDISMMPEMLEHSREGSPAHTYAQHQIDVQTVFPGPPVEEQMEVGEDSITLTAQDDQGQDVETTFADFEASPQGLLVRFSVDGTPVAERIAGPGASGSSSGITVTLRSAYQTITGTSLNIMVDVTNGTDGPFNDTNYQSAYISNDGRQYAPTQATGQQAPIVQPGGTAIVFIEFQQAPVGGRLVYKGFLNDFLTEVTVEVPIRPYEAA